MKTDWINQICCEEFLKIHFFNAQSNIQNERSNFYQNAYLFRDLLRELVLLNCVMKSGKQDLLFAWEEFFVGFKSGAFTALRDCGDGQVLVLTCPWGAA